MNHTRISGIDTWSNARYGCDWMDFTRILGDAAERLHCPLSHAHYARRLAEAEVLELGVQALIEIDPTLRKGKRKPRKEDALVLVYGLPDAQREALQLRANGLSYEEIAKEMNRTVKSVDGLLTRARGVLGSCVHITTCT